MRTHVKPKVLVVLRPNRTEPPTLLQKAGELAQFIFVVEPEEIQDTDLDAPIVFVWNFRSRFVPQMTNRLPDLEWVHVAAVGVDASMSDEVVHRKVVVTNARGVTAQAMAEYALAMMLHHAKDFATTVSDQRERQWRPRNTRNLAGSRLLLVGVGAVNQTLARMAGAIGMNIVGVGRSQHPPRAPFERIVGGDQLREVLGDADYVVVATPLTPETRGLFGPEEFAAMKDGAVFINIGRGDVVDERSLMSAIASDRLGGVGLDVVWREPLESDHPLWASPAVLLSPHMSSDAIGWEEGMVDAFVDNLRRWADGRSLANQVDKRLGYVPSSLARQAEP